MLLILTAFLGFGASSPADTTNPTYYIDMNGGDEEFSTPIEPTIP